MCNFIAKCYNSNAYNTHLVASTNILQPVLTLKAHTGAVKCFVKTNDKMHLHGFTDIFDGPIAILPNNKIISPTHEETLPLPKQVSTTAKSALV